MRIKAQFLFDNITKIFFIEKQGWSIFENRQSQPLISENIYTKSNDMEYNLIKKLARKEHLANDF